MENSSLGPSIEETETEIISSLSAINTSQEEVYYDYIISFLQRNQSKEDKDSQIPLPQIVHVGWLEKRDSFGTWHKRFSFVTSDKKFYRYESIQVLRSGPPPLGIISLDESEIIISDLYKDKGKIACFQVTFNNKVEYYNAPNVYSLIEWLYVLKNIKSISDAKRERQLEESQSSELLKEREESESSEFKFQPPLPNDYSLEDKSYEALSSSETQSSLYSSYIQKRRNLAAPFVQNFDNIPHLVPSSNFTPTLPELKCTDEQVLNRLGLEAYSKPIDHIIGKTINGRSGRDGKSGKKGNDALATDEKELNGSNGEDAEDGTNGEDGSNAPNIEITLTGNEHFYSIKGSVENKFQFSTDSVIVINCKGGNGGNGGNGGDGGDGGLGATPLYEGESKGGNGGNGGKGGNGGNGGNGGDGGHITIKVNDPTLLMLVEVDCRGGKGGIGGAAGNGGIGGGSGFGALAPPVNVRKTSFSGKENLSARAPSGAPGVKGNPGQPGASGKDGKCGSVSYIVEDTIYPFRYNLFVDGFKVVSDTEGGIFTPGCNVTISDIKVTNNGGMPCPGGAIFSISSNETFQITSQSSFTLPEIAVGETFVIPQTFTGQIFDVPEPQTSGHYYGHAIFTSQISLRNRDFSSSVIITEIPVQYPVKIQTLLCTSQMAFGETDSFVLTLVNISNSLQKYSLHIFLNCNFFCQDYPNAEEKLVIDKEIQPQTTENLPIKLSLSETCQLFSRPRIRVELQLNSKVTQLVFHKIRVCPAFSLDTTCDLLFFSNSSVTQKEFRLWNKIFQAFQLKVDYLDLGKRGEDENKLDWSAKCRNGILFVPFGRDGFSELDPKMLLSHFLGSDWEKNPVFYKDSSIVMLDIEANQTDDIFASLFQLTPSIPYTGKNFGGNHVTSPNVYDAIQRARFTVRELMRYDREGQYRLEKMDLKFEKVGTTSWWYGQLEVKKFPLNKSVRWISFPSKGFSEITFSLSEKIKSQENGEIVPISSSFFSCLLSVLCALNVEAKVKLIFSAQCLKWSFSFPNESMQISWVDFLSLVISDELILESKYCLRLYRVHEFADAVEKHAASIKENADFINCVIKICLYYQRQIGSVFDTVSQKEIKNLVDRIGFVLGFTPTSLSPLATSLFSFQLSDLVPLQYPLLSLHFSSVSKENVQEGNLTQNQWIRDKEVNHCEACNVQFSVVIRKHHCRNCTKIFCNSCSSKSIILKSKGFFNPVRVCDACYTENLQVNWKSDKDSNECSLCNSQFGFLKRKHHCRHCGSIVCADCSARDVHISNSGQVGPVRVCDTCYTKITKVQWENDADVTLCKICKIPFSLLRRKHHCRNCGSIVCGNCSTHNYVLPNVNKFLHVRVCDTCFQNLSKKDLPSSSIPSSTSQENLQQEEHKNLKQEEDEN